MTSFALPVDADNEVAVCDAAYRLKNLLRSASARQVVTTAAAAAGTRVRRLVVTGPDAAGLTAGLDAYARGERTGDWFDGDVRGRREPQVVFVFPGHGTQWAGMGRHLMTTEPVYRRAVEECDAVLRPLTGWSPAEALAGAEMPAGVDVVQPLLFTLQVGLARLWQSWGVQPDAVVGHSMGEVAAAFVAGALCLPDAARVIVHRSRLLRTVSGRNGGMALVQLPLDRAEALIADEAQVCVAACNGAETTVLTGDLDALHRIVAGLLRRDVFCRLLATDVAMHSPQLNPIRDELAAAVADVSPRTPAVRLYSTVTGQVVTGPDLDAGYWVRNLRQQVLFWPAVAALAADDRTHFVELGPHPTLLPAIQRGLAGDPTVRCLPSLRRHDTDAGTMHRSAAALYTAGRAVRWTAVHAAVDGAAGLDLVVTPDSPGYVADHRLDGVPVLPGAAHLELAARCAGAGRDLVDVRFRRPLVVDRPYRLRAALSADGTLTVADGSAGAYATMTVAPGTPHPDADLAAAGVGCTEPVPVEAFYGALAAAGLDYGPSLRGIVELHRGEGAALGRLSPGSAGHPGAARIDMCLQVALAALPENRAALIEGIGRFRLLAAADDAVWTRADRVFAQVRSRPDAARVSVTVLLTTDLGRVCLAAQDLVFHLIAPVPPTPVPAEAHGRAYRVGWTPLPAPADTGSAGRWLVLADGDLGPAVAAGLRDAVLVRSGAGLRQFPDGSWSLDPTDPAQVGDLLARVGGPLAGVAHLWALGAGTGPDATVAELTTAQDAGARSVLHVVRALDRHPGARPSLTVFTRSAVAVVAGDRPDPAHTAVWGLGRVVLHERNDLPLTLADLDRADPDTVLAELVADPAEPQVAWRGGVRYGARLLAARVGEPTVLSTAALRLAAAAGAAELAVPTAGDLHATGLRWTRVGDPGPDEVQVDLLVGGVNFADVMHATGLLATTTDGPLALGMEGAGVIAAVGPGVDRYAPGDRVILLWDRTAGGLATRRTISTDLVAPWPAALSDVEAATLPTVFVTAEYALRHVARLQPGERVLIHAAAGGVGLAAIQVAQEIGAEVFATAGSPEKRAMLRALGIDHVMNSRTLDFADEVRAATNGRGVDVVLNSLAGAAIGRGLAALAPFGRFVELGKRDVHADHRIGMAALGQNLTFAVVDVDQLIRRRPDTAGELLRAVSDRFATGQLFPLPVQEWPVEQAGAALREMAAGTHTGKLALRMPDPEGPADPPAVRPDGSYLITGGLGGLGLLTAGVLVALGARHVHLVGRRQPGRDAVRAIETLRRAGATIRAHTADAADAEALAAAIAAADGDAPLRGVVHAAGFIADATLDRQHWDTFRPILSAKLDGAWNLHRLTGGHQLDFMLLYSSVAAVLGTIGQANYAAANGFLDGLAAHRVARGLPAVSVNWGTWRDVGTVRDEIADLLGARGLPALTPLEGARWVADLLLGKLGQGQVAVMGFDAGRWAASHPHARAGRFLSTFPSAVSRAAPAPAATPDDGAAPGPAPDATHAVRGQIARILRMPLDRVGAEDRINHLGVDSLMAVELRNALSAKLGASVPMAEILRDPTVGELASLVDRNAAARPARQAPAPSVAVDQVGALSDAEVDALLAESLGGAAPPQP